MSKRLDGIVGCKDKTSSWHLIGFPDGSNIGSTVSYRGETHRYTVHLLTLMAMQGHQTSHRQKTRRAWITAQFITLGQELDGCPTDEGNLLVMGVERCVLTSSKYDVEIKWFKENVVARVD